MTFDFHPEAEAELLESIDYYEEYEPGLGEDFSLEVFLAIQNVLEFPTAWPILDGDVRRCLVNRFPFAILYSIEQGKIHIVAVMHLHREPEYWKKRR